MFIYTARIPKKRLMAGGFTLLCCLAVILLSLLFAPGGNTAAAMAEVRGIRDNDDRIAYLQQLGWSVSSEPIAVDDLMVPKEFDDSYGDYLALQSGQGFDLTAYCGKRIKRYTYEITNYPTGEEGIQVSLLIYKSTVIGGEVLSPTTGGFLHGLAMPTVKSETTLHLSGDLV